jgi:hypothetical protein
MTRQDIIEIPVQGTRFRQALLRTWVRIAGTDVWILATVEPYGELA